ncbi:glutathionylspermidine synthase family protein [Sphingobium sufflavum]|uniref:glutathionylspermidine synthase family protein n=1 Tax=Sphingobium sufflavum TaxID=1129547 RepID=UPI001F419C65|nr:glutathionylspermidine synthase family protein [Sphingobium sufflavum]MCE7796195.1 glutathionylspermidine synthase family protein [Sphingobium sufflavum]
MKRVAIAPRPDWEEIARASGFTFHHVAGERYWDESAYWQFTLEEVERDIESPAAELHEMCLNLCDEVVGSEALMDRIAIPPAMRDIVARSWREGAPSLYGRFDFAYDGTGPAKLLEYNADTPTSIYETAYFQWEWLEDMVARGNLPAGTDQFNRLHEALMERFGTLLTPGSLIHFSSSADHVEDRQTVAYLQDLAGQAGLDTEFVAIDRIGLDGDGRFVDERQTVIGALFKLYPWEDMLREPYAAAVPGSKTLFLEPAWKAILSNKAILPLLWERHKGHPNLLPAAFVGDGQADAIEAGAHVVKPFFSREGADVVLVDGATRLTGTQQGYGAEGRIVQAHAALAQGGGQHAVIGAWIVGNEPVALSVREDDHRITRDLARFVPHVIAP